MMSNSLIDLVDDLHRGFEVGRDMPKPMRKLSLDSLTKLSKLKDDNYALIIKTGHGNIRKYPIHDKDSVILSAWYLSKRSSSLTERARRKAEHFIVKAANKLGLIKSTSTHSFKDNTVVDGIPVRRSTHYALGGKWPIETENQVKLARDYFEENYKFFNPHERRKFVTALEKRAGELNITPGVGNVLMKYAGENKLSPFFSIAIDKRIKQAEGLTKEILQVLEQRALNGEDPNRVASALNELDVNANFKNVPNAYESVFSYSTLKDNRKAAEADGLKTRLYKVSGNPQFAQAFDSKFVASFRQSPVEMYNSLPISTRELVDKMSKESQ